MKKTCFKCNIEKDLSEYYKHPKMADGHLGKCKDCAKQDVKERYDKNPEKIREYEKKRSQSEHRKQYNKKLRQRDKHKEWCRRWRELKKDDPEYQQKRKRYLEEYKQRDYYKELSYNQTRRYRETYPEKYKAHCAVNNAVRDGRLIKEPCEICGDPQSEAHHEDYSKPLDVIWLCDKHHKEIHKSKES